ncbi:NADH dehydrogenase [ubiquinone] iron-sulfur protein 5 isoform 2-T2 [Glossophaga mutica]
MAENTRGLSRGRRQSTQPRRRRSTGLVPMVSGARRRKKGLLPASRCERRAASVALLPSFAAGLRVSCRLSTNRSQRTDKGTAAGR